MCPELAFLSAVQEPLTAMVIIACWRAQPLANSPSCLLTRLRPRRAAPPPPSLRRAGVARRPATGQAPPAGHMPA
eukprot:63002-Pyramimonas_sp.AAC.1